MDGLPDAHGCRRSDDRLEEGGIGCSPVEIEGKLVSQPRLIHRTVRDARAGAARG